MFPSIDIFPNQDYAEKFEAVEQLKPVSGKILSFAEIRQRTSRFLEQHIRRQQKAKATATPTAPAAVATSGMGYTAAAAAAAAAASAAEVNQQAASGGPGRGKAKAKAAKAKAKPAPKPKSKAKAKAAAKSQAKAKAKAVTRKPAAAKAKTKATVAAVAVAAQASPPKSMGSLQKKRQRSITDYTEPEPGFDISKLDAAQIARDATASLHRTLNRRRTAAAKPTGKALSDCD